jgi:hypothetical protein
MNDRVARIDSYFSLPTDVTAELRAFPEFVTGQGYHAELRSAQEQVSVAFHPAQDDDSAHVLVTGKGDGALFLTVLGSVVHSMAAHSDSVWVTRWENADET